MHPNCHLMPKKQQREIYSMPENIHLESLKNVVEVQELRRKNRSHTNIYSALLPQG